jgi:hypothetical protein
MMELIPFTVDYTNPLYAEIWYLIPLIIIVQKMIVNPLSKEIFWYGDTKNSNFSIETKYENTI